VKKFDVNDYAECFSEKFFRGRTYLKPMKLVAGIDIGGTKVKCVVADEKGRFLVSLKEPIDVRSERAIVEQLFTMISQACKKAKIEKLAAVGIASAGPMNLAKGELMKPTNIPFPRVPLVRPLEEELEIPVCLLNDCSAAVLGEAIFGAGKGEENVVYVGIGTGIGGGAIVDGHLLFGKDGNACEIGHIVVDPAGRLECGCGKRGHWEAYCSGKNIPNFVRMRLEEMGEKSDLSELGSKEIYQRARSGDKLALKLVMEIAELNAVGLADVVNVYDPSILTLGGSVALKDSDLVVEPAKKRIAKYLRNRKPKVVTTPLGEDAVLFGAVALALNPEVLPKKFRHASRFL